jgi:hypothetical protein
VKVAAVLVLALAVSPVAWAKPVCADIKRLTDHALDGFKIIKGNPTSYDPHSFTASLALPRADECIVRGAPVIYECSWTYDSLDSLAAAEESLQKTIGACLSGWQLVVEKKGTQDLGGSAEITSLGTMFHGSGRHESVSVRSWAVETIQKGSGFRALRLRISLDGAPRIA